MEEQFNVCCNAFICLGQLQVDPTPMCQILTYQNWWQGVIVLKMISVI